MDFRVLLAAVAVWAVAAAVAFRSVIGSSFDFVFGDDGDGRLIVYLHEHLFNALAGRAEFLSPPMFYPQKNVLGYSDAFLLDALPYAALRSIGLDPFLSFQIFATALSLCCFIASLIIGIRYLQLRFPLAVCAAILVTFPNNLMFKTHIGHLQFFAIYYVPCIVLLALWGIEDFPRVTRWSLTRLGIAAALFGLLFATAYYVAWMFAITAIIALGVAAIIRGVPLIAAMKKYRGPVGKLAGAALFGFAAGVVPLAYIYAPALASFSGRTFSDYLFFAPFPKDVINVGRWNMVWGWLVERLLDDGVEVTLAVTPGMVGIFLAMAYRFHAGTKHSNGGAWQPVFFIACCGVWAVSWLLTAKIGTVSLFWLAYHIIPGATAIRAGERIQLLVNMWVVSGLAVLLQSWIDAAPLARRRRNRVLSGAILTFCLIEQINLLPAGSLSRSREFAWLAAVPEPPKECRAFLVFPRNENDALWISLRADIPTLNGVSGWFPPGWQLEDAKTDYFDAARQWIQKTRLDQQVCLYDKSARTWSRFR